MTQAPVSTVFWTVDAGAYCVYSNQELKQMGCDLSRVNLSFFLKRYSQSAINHCP